MDLSEEKAIRSFSEFKRLYYPRSFEEEKMEIIADPIALGISLANKSLERLKNQLAEATF